MTPAIGKASGKPGTALILNPGSSSLKWACLDLQGRQCPKDAGEFERESWDDELKELVDKHDFDVAAIRFVHGGNEFFRPAWIDEPHLTALERLATEAPLHTLASLACSRTLAALAPALGQIAVFDTEFFHDLPPVAKAYGLPRELTTKYGIRRFGFHGFAHDGMYKAWASLDERYRDGEARVVTIQLGSGCSMAAIRKGHPLDTTMGFTPNEGLLMSSRSGDIDPGLLTWLQRREGWSPDDTDRVLNQQSGWLGMSGLGADMGELLRNRSGHAALAIDLFKHRVRKNLGAYFVLLGGLDAVVFSGGVAEHAPVFCAEIIAGLEHLGISLPEPGREQDSPGHDGDVQKGLLPRRLTSRQSTVACWCVPGNEHASMLDSINAFLARQNR